MSISVNLKRITNLPGRYDRKVELSFRGFTHKTKILKCENLAIFNEHFRWPHYGKRISDEVLCVSVYNSSKVFSNRLLGKLVISLQHVVTSGRLLLREPLTDSNYSQTDIYIELDVRYHPLQGAAGGWEGEDFLAMEDEEESSGLVLRNTGFVEPEAPGKKLRPERLERETRRLGRGLLAAGSDDEDDDDDDDDFSEMDSINITFTPLFSRFRPLYRRDLAAVPRVQNFQVNVNILEAQKLSGVNINPAVFVRLGDQKRNTITQKSTNFPFYNESFIFEFHETPELLFDKVVQITVVHRKLLPFLMDRIGIFKIDISTIYNQSEHRFHQKWAPLSDPDDTRAGIKGYVKASLSVIMKGDPMATPPPNNAASEDIERNLMLPRGIPAERPWAKFLVRVYRAEGLPSMDSGFLGAFSKMRDKKVFIDPYVQVTFAGQQGETSVASSTNCPVWNEQISFIEQFPPLARRLRIQILDDANIGNVAVATHFLDLQEISDPTRNGFNPTFGPSWVNLYGSPKNSSLGDVHQALNQGLGQGIFYRGRILLGLSVEVYTSPVATETGPASGKAKGALGRLGMKRKSRKSNDKNNQEGQAEEASSEVPEAVTVEMEEIHPLPEDFFGEKEDFLLFSSLFEVTMMDPEIGRKPVTFEMSIGNHGKAVTVSRTKKTNVGRSREDLSRSREELRRSREDLDEESQGLLETSEDELDREEVEDPGTENRSLSVPLRPQPTEYDKSFSCLPLQSPLAREKPCLYIWSQFEDHIFRYHAGNWLHKIADRLESGVEEVDHLLRRPRSNAKGRLVEVLLELVASCKQYIAQSSKKTQSKPNNLDKCRREFLKKNVILVAKQALRARRRLTRRVAKQRLTDTRKILRKLRLLAKEPQSTIPDVFLWLLSGGKRVAYCRIPIHSILFSLVEEQRGRDCGKLTTLYMKAPEGAVGAIFAKLEVYMWMGITKYAKESLSCLPGEFLPLFEEDGGEAQPANLALQAKKAPIKLSCQDSRYFQLRAHIYQARGILAADDNGLSDPFAKVLFATQCQVTRVMGETLSPAWCEMLLFDRVLMEGRKEELRDDPPLVIISLFDYDTMGSPDPLGLAFAEPEFKFVEEPYRKPQLRFFDISRGKAAAGELLAAFELIELDYSVFGEPCLPADVDPREPQFLTEENCYIIPEGVRPVLKTFRIEVLFWGLRDLRRVHLFEVERPQVRVECGGNRLESEEMESYKLNPNFKEIIKYFDVELPEVPYLQPPLTIFVVEQRAFGRMALVGTHIVPSLMAFAPRELGDGLDDEEEEPKLQVMPDTPLNTVKGMDLGGLSIKQSKIPINPLNLLSTLLKQKNAEEELEEETPEKSELDWWSKYYASIEELNKQSAMEEETEEQAEAEGGMAAMLEEEEVVIVEIEPPKPKRKKIATLKLYFCELEDEFNQFMDWLHAFPLFKGKASGDDDEDEEDNRTMGKYKGSFLIYPIAPEDEDAKCRIINGIPRNTPVKVLVRVYIIKATNLAPRDASKKPDPYLVVKVGQQSVDTKDRYIAKQFNPVFGEVFELTVSFPLETDLSLMVYDHNLVGSDDVIGETRIDLENRFYSLHYASCGLALYYDPDGYNMWHDANKPSTILADLCRKNSIPAPEYRVSEVKVLNKIFKIPPDAFPEELLKKNTTTEEEEEEMEEHKALSVLHRWEEMREFCPNALPLVSEHVEMRCLMNPDKPGLPRGFVHMWIDMFPVDVPAPPPIDIKPRLPIDYELRVIIWNTDDVVLADINPFTGAPSSDIYVKGWIKGLEDDKQETDVHFNSLTGEGNFNWRFVFRFSYLPTEKEIVYQKKESIFSVDKTEFRQPAVLVLQVWDYDIIGSNDFLGSIELRLSDMVRAAKASSKCTIQMAKERAVPRFSIFRSKRMKGWWPLIRQRSQEDIEKEEKEKEEEKKSGKKTKKKDKRSKMKPEDIQFTDSGGNIFLLMGKVEAELQLVTLEEAEAAPVGRKRKEPEPLDKPDRPSLSFSWFLNPLKTFVFFIWKNYKKYIIILFILAILTIFLVLILYTLPNQISSLIIHG
ncbi:fer-1-like protein 4 [Aplochiton taeniatus]